jgi:hypothetical protein
MTNAMRVTITEPTIIARMPKLPFAGRQVSSPNKP